MRNFFVAGLVGLLSVQGVAAMADTPPANAVTVGSHKVTMKSGPDISSTVFLDGKSVIHDAYAATDSIFGSYTFPDYSVVLITEDGDGGNACDFSFFQALIITDSGYSIVNQFGGCGPSTVSKTSDSVVVSGIASNTPGENQVFTITKSGLVTSRVKAPPPKLTGPGFTPGMDLAAVVSSANIPTDPLTQKAVYDRITQLYGTDVYQQLSNDTMRSGNGQPYQNINSFEVNFLGEPHSGGCGAYLVFDHVGDVWVGMFTSAFALNGFTNGNDNGPGSLKWLGSSPPPPAVVAAAKEFQQ